MALKLYGVNATIIIFVFVLYCIVLYCIVLYCIYIICANEVHLRVFCRAFIERTGKEVINRRMKEEVM